MYLWTNSFRPRRGAHSQAVHDGSPLALLALALPLVHLQDQLEEGTLGGGHFSVPRPSQVLELANHQVAFLWLRESHGGFSQSITDRKETEHGFAKKKKQSCAHPGEVADSEESTDDVAVH